MTDPDTPRSVFEEKGVRNRKTTFLHQCARNGFLTPYPPRMGSQDRHHIGPGVYALRARGTLD